MGVTQTAIDALDGPDDRRRAWRSLIVYLDTSAAFKLAFEEAESSALTAFLADAGGDDLISAWLLHTEMFCAARRQGSASLELVADVLSRVELIDVTQFNFRQAAQIPGRLRSADALHLAVALDCRAEAMLVYDTELAAAARAAGMQVIAPR